MSSTKGTAVPSKKFVEKVYVNTSLSIEEVVSIINNANLEYTIGDYKVCGYIDNNAIVESIGVSNLILVTISVHDTIIFRESDPSGNYFVGWDENFNGVVEINQYNAFGAQNDALTELFSITPFTQAQDEKVIVSKSKLIAIADNIRNQTGTTDLITLDEMASIKLGSESGNDMLQTKVDTTASCAYLFYGSTVDNVDYISALDTSNVTNMSYMFYQCSNLTSIPQLDTSNVTNMERMFRSCTNLTSIPQLNTSKVTNMSALFSYCSNLTSIPQLDTSNVTYMGTMFSSCGKLESIPQLNTSKVGDMQEMFMDCYSLKNVPQLDTSKVSTSMQKMFYRCRYLPKIDISYYNVSSASKVASWCYNCHSLKAIIIRSFGTNYVLNTNSLDSCYHLSGTKDSTYNPNGDKDGYIYVPRNMVDTLKSATNWSKHADQIRALEDYTVDGTTTGELDESKVNA